jgi:hypothetical protein
VSYPTVKVRRTDHYFNLDDDELRVVADVVEREALVWAGDATVVVRLRERLAAEIERRGLRNV